MLPLGRGTAENAIVTEAVGPQLQMQPRRTEVLSLSPFHMAELVAHIFSFANLSIKDLLAFEGASRHHQLHTGLVWERLKEQKHCAFQWKVLSQDICSNKCDYQLSKIFNAYISGLPRKNFNLILDAEIKKYVDKFPYFKLFVNYVESLEETRQLKIKNTSCEKQKRLEKQKNSLNKKLNALEKRRETSESKAEIDKLHYQLRYVKANLKTIALGLKRKARWLEEKAQKPSLRKLDNKHWKLIREDALEKTIVETQGSTIERPKWGGRSVACRHSRYL